MDLGIAVPALDWVLAGIAVATQNLDGSFGHVGGNTASLELGHRTFGVDERLLFAEPRGTPDQQTGGLDLGGHIGQHERNRLVHDDLATKGFALFGVVE